MTDDRALLEAAAKAAGIDLAYKPFEHNRGDGAFTNDGTLWNPLRDDGDALRLAVKLGMDLIQFTGRLRVDLSGTPDVYQLHDGDPYAATRRAIVRAAASLSRGERMEG